MTNLNELIIDDDGYVMNDIDEILYWYEYNQYGSPDTTTCVECGCETASDEGLCYECQCLYHSRGAFDMDGRGWI